MSTAPSSVRLVVTCEHGGNRVPEPYRPLFQGADEVLSTHRGWDPGALPVARSLAERLDAPLVVGTTTRLLVELNRTLDHPSLFSEYTRHLPPEARQRILDRHYLPHRRRVESEIRRQAEGGRPVLHLGVHSFTPVLAGRERAVDVGLLYDPARSGEERVCRAWAAELRQAAPGLRVAGNEPYRGTDDGLSTFLRGRYPPDVYLGVEIEINQALVARDDAARGAVTERVAESLARSVELAPAARNGGGSGPA